MKLIGMLDSPYVRRVAISLLRLGLPFEHEPLSVFRTYEAFSRINPVVKAPTLVCDDGTVLMDSSLIIDYAEALARPRSLLPAEPTARAHDLRRVGLALAAMEKAVQRVYEDGQRPSEKRHEPWVARVMGQLQAAFAGLEAEIARQPPAAGDYTIGQAGISAAVAWDFTQRMLPQALAPQQHPALVAFSAAAEALPAFRAAPFGDGRVQPLG